MRLQGTKLPVMALESTTRVNRVSCLNNSKLLIRGKYDHRLDILSDEKKSLTLNTIGMNFSSSVWNVVFAIRQCRGMTSVL